MSGNDFIIKAYNNGDDNIYIQKALLNGRELNVPYIDFADIAKGGMLELFMGPVESEWAAL